MLKKIIILLFFPLYILFEVLHPKKINLKSIIVNILKLVVAIFILAPIWGTGYFLLTMEISDYFGFIYKPIQISGTGSMYPTFPKGTKKTIEEQANEVAAIAYMLPYPNGFDIQGKRYFGYTLTKGDIVEFSNKKTEEITKKLHGTPAGMVKRIVALPGDMIEIKDGIVMLNSASSKEPYTARARSTFGGSYLSDCQKLKIPPGKLFVMGDNRKGSGDSRYELGLIDDDDVGFVLPLEKQKGIYDKNWRDTKDDLLETSKIRIDKEKYLNLLNERRVASGVKPLKYQPKLDESSKKRGEIILKFDDLSFEATRSGYTMKSAMNESGYSNIIWGEAPIIGYYTEEELIENQFEFPASKNFLLNKDYQDFGMSEVEGEINNCPTQIVVQQYAGYVPPNYKKSEIDSWKRLLEKLKEIRPNWKNLENYKEFYEKNKKDIDRINEIINERIKNTESVVKKMNENIWLSDDEEKYIKVMNPKLNEEQEMLSNKLNNL